MDFRFRAIDDKPPATASSTSVCSAPDHLLQDDSPHAELVKQMIKEEIVIREIAARRMLEAEIRRELIIEQELAMYRATSKKTEAGPSFDNQFSLRLLDQRLNHTVDQSLGGLVPAPGSSSSLNLLPVRPFPEPQKEEPKPLDDEKDKLIFLARPDPGKFEAKRKAKEAPAEADTHRTVPPIPSKSSKKLAKDDFICAVCKITTTSEITFNAHLKGKKHRAKERRGLQTKKKSLAEDKGKLDSKNTVRAATDQKPAPSHHDIKFWCEICQIGTSSMAVMDAHNKGKKHRARLLKLAECKLDELKEPHGTDDDTIAP